MTLQATPLLSHELLVLPLAIDADRRLRSLLDGAREASSLAFDWW
jgi:hypothetical protein